VTHRAEFQHERILGALHFEPRSLSAVLIVKYYVSVIRKEEVAGLAAKEQPCTLLPAVGPMREGGS